MPPTHRFIHFRSPYRHLTRLRIPPNLLCKECGCSVPASAAQRRLLFNRIRVRHERQHIAKRLLVSIGIEAHDNHVFAMPVDGGSHKGNQTADKELGLIDHHSGRRCKVRHLKNCSKPVHRYGLCRNRESIMIDNRCHSTLVAIVNVRCQN